MAIIVLLPITLPFNLQRNLSQRKNDSKTQANFSNKPVDDHTNNAELPSYPTVNPPADKSITTQLAKNYRAEPRPEASSDNQSDPQIKP